MRIKYIMLAFMLLSGSSVTLTAKWTFSVFSLYSVSYSKTVLISDLIISPDIKVIVSPCRSAAHTKSRL